MKPSQVMSKRYLGRPVAYYPNLAKILGGVNATVFWCQLYYWTDKQHDPEGWIYKTQDELMEETGLSFDEQRTVRKKLKDKGVLEEEYRRLEHKLYYRLNFDAFDALFESNFPKSGIPISGAKDAQSRGDGESKFGIIGTENTTEITNNSCYETEVSNNNDGLSLAKEKKMPVKKKKPKAQKVKVEKKSYGKYQNVKLTDEEHAQLQEELTKKNGEGYLEFMINVVDNWMEKKNDGGSKPRIINFKKYISDWAGDERNMQEFARGKSEPLSSQKRSAKDTSNDQVEVYLGLLKSLEELQQNGLYDNLAKNINRFLEKGMLLVIEKRVDQEEPGIYRYESFDKSQLAYYFEKALRSLGINPDQE